MMLAGGISVEDSSTAQCLTIPSVGLYDMPPTVEEDR